VTQSWLVAVCQLEEEEEELVEREGEGERSWDSL